MTEAQARRIKLILFDVDGVLTDGKILLHPDGTESKQFDIKDGTGIVLAQRAGLTVGFLSARTSTPTTRRAAQLGVTLLHQGVPSKIETYDQIVDELLHSKECALLCTHRPVLPTVLDSLGIVTDKLAPGELVVAHHRKGKVAAFERY